MVPKPAKEEDDMTNRRDVLKGLGIGAALPATAPVGEAPYVEPLRKQVVTRIRIGLVNPHLNYFSSALWLH